MTVASCPEPEILIAFTRGELAPEKLVAVAGHVGGCEACCRALKLIPQDSLANLARVAAAEPFTVQSVGPPATLLPTDPNETIPAGFVDHPRYRIINKLGAGGMGTVYKAEDLLMGRVIAIKVVSTHLTSKPGAVARFQTEIRAAAQLKDHHFVTAHDTGEAGGAHYLVMEFVEGVSLDRLVAKKGPLSLSLASMFTRQVALGLQHAAEKGMVHRDIKPQNLMVTRKGQVKILDFGLARLAQNEAEGETLQLRRPAFGAGKLPVNFAVTNPDQVMGTPDYLSPEQARNSHDVDARSDIYSLGCTLYFLLTGRPPFSAVTTQFDKLLAHVEEEPPPIIQKRPDVPEDLAAVLAKMMAKKPADRYQKASEVAAALLPFTRSDATKEPSFEIVEAVVVTPAPPNAPNVTASPMVAVPQAESSDTAPPAEPTLAETPRPKRAKKKKKRASWWQRRKWTVIGSALVLGLLVGGAIALHGRKWGHPPHPSPQSDNAKLNDSASHTPASKIDKADKKTSGNPVTVIAPTSDLIVLYVIPSNGVFVPDYRDVRQQLEAQRAGKGGVRVETAATSGDKSQAADGFGEAIPIDVRLAVGMNLNKYAAVVFCGDNVDEYLTGAGTSAARDVIERMQKASKPVAAICAGQAVLAHHGVLKGRKAAFPPRAFDTGKFRTEVDSSISWQKMPVVVDKAGGKIVITAAGPPQAKEFAADILQAIGK